MKKQLIVSVAALGLLAGCGYSEDEWQAQLAKYEKLNAAYGAEKAEHAKARQELEELQARIGELTKQLEDMGFKLQETGTEKQKLGARLEELNKALEEEAETKTFEVKVSPLDTAEIASSSVRMIARAPSRSSIARTTQRW